MNKQFDPNKIIERMKKLREKMGYTQDEVATDLKISRSYYAAIENKIKKVSLRNAALFADQYGVTVDWLIWGEDPRIKGNVYGNETGNVSQNVHMNVAEPETTYEKVWESQILNAKDDIIKALHSENEALKELITMLKKQLK